MSANNEDLDLIGRNIGEQPRGFIYAIVNPRENCVKIGFSLDPSRRLTVLQTANATKLILAASWPGTLADESYLHFLYSDYRANGEWFHLNQFITDDIARRTNVDLSGYETAEIDALIHLPVDAYFDFSFLPWKSEDYFTAPEVRGMILQTVGEFRFMDFGQSLRRLSIEHRVKPSRKYWLETTRKTGTQTWRLRLAYPRSLIERAIYAYLLIRYEKPKEVIGKIIKQTRDIKPKSVDFLPVLVREYLDNLHWV